jgi:hypothetical protein
MYDNVWEFVECAFPAFVEDMVIMEPVGSRNVRCLCKFCTFHCENNLNLGTNLLKRWHSLYSPEAKFDLKATSNALSESTVHHRPEGYAFNEITEDL